MSLAESILSHNHSNGSYWAAKSLLLIVEIRTCKCGRIYRCPGNFHVKLEAGNRVWLNPAPETYTRSILGLHERREVHTQIEACEGCFETVPEKQLCLFPTLFQPTLVLATERAASAYEAEERARIVQEAAKNARLAKLGKRIATPRVKSSEPPAKKWIINSLDDI